MKHTMQLVAVLTALAAAADQLVQSGVLSPKHAIIAMALTNILSSLLPALRSLLPPSEPPAS